MHVFAIGVAWLVALSIIGIGLMYLAIPRTATLSFGLPLPEEGANVIWWLRLKGVRDVVSGLIVLALLTSAGTPVLGTVLLVEALIPIGDMSLILTARGSTGRALGVHGMTAALMVAAAALLITGAA